MKPADHATPLALTLLLIAANALIPVAILTFAKGFFPYKPLLPGLATYDSSEYGQPPAAPFDRVIFMVVDALRSDFVYTQKSGFQFTQSLIRDGSALPFTAHAASPTVTMPRIKAITTGSIPSFLDVILNIDEGDKSSSLASQDTWLAQMKAKDTGKMILYGDDTWMKLFPDTFDRADGTSSFFVADFTEVDNNVTRHVADELKNDDWNTMILHYLGLDHIGHKGGPRSSNMLPKQHEMDGIVRQLYQAMTTERHLESTLLVMCGDHGMNDAGNHGASSAGETSPALLFISPKLRPLSTQLQSPLEEREDFRYYSFVEQSDLAPTLAALLGFPIPKNNLGAFISDFLPLWNSAQDKKQILMRNARQILETITATFGAELFQATNKGNGSCEQAHTDIEELACDWQDIIATAGSDDISTALDPEWVEKISKWLARAQGIMSSTASNYDVPNLVLGQVIAALSAILAIATVYLTASDPAQSFVPFGCITLAYGIMMFASSYVEEEHHFWYWATTSWLVAMSVPGFDGKIRSRVAHTSALLVAFTAYRMIRSWNQTGQKFAGEPDIVKIFLTTNPVLLWMCIIAAYLWIHRELVKGFDGVMAAINIAGSTGLVLAAFSFKLAFTNEDSPELMAGFAQAVIGLAHGDVTLVNRARAVFIGLAVATACVLGFMLTRRRLSIKTSALETLLYLYTLFAMTQSRATNIPLFLLLDVVNKYLAAQDLSRTGLTTATLLLQFTSFFAFGGTNAISSVDLSSAYNGVAGFNVVAVGLLTFFSNWAGAVYWTFAAAVLLERKRKAGGGAVFFRHVALLTVFTAASVAFVMAACTLLRTHLFVWTVFSPKYLYCMAWSLGVHLGVNVGLGGVLYWLGSL